MVCRVSHAGLDTPTIRRIAVEAERDPRTVVRVIAGEPVRPTARRSILRAMRSLQIKHPVLDEEGPSAA